MSTLEFNQLLVTQSEFLRGFALGFTRNGADADDLVQDTMVKALRYKNNFKEGTNMKGWLYTIMRNIFINNYKRKKFQNTVLDSTDNQFFINASQNYRADTVTTVINENDILEAIDGLKPDFRKPFTMFSGWIPLRRNRGGNGDSHGNSEVPHLPRPQKAVVGPG